MLNKEQGRTAIIFMFVPPPKGWPPNTCCKVVFLGTLNKSEKNRTALRNRHVTGSVERERGGK